MENIFNIENIVIFVAGAYLAGRGLQEGYRYFRKKYYQDYLPLKYLRQYKENSDVYHYHLFNLAQKFINQERIAKSRKYLEIILKDDPDYDQANYLMGIVAFSEKNYHDARLHLERETHHNPDHPMVYFFLGQSYFKLGMFNQALQAVKKSLELNPYYYSCYLLAIDIYSKLSLDPREEWLFFQQAEIHKCLTRPIWLHMARLEEQFLSKAERENRANFYETLEKNWAESGQLKEKTLQALAGEQFYKAENFTLQGLQINPHDNQLYQLYDRILIVQKKFSSALEFYKNSYKRINYNPLEATLRLVDYYVFNKEYQLALEKMVKIFKKHPNAKFLHYPLGVLYNWINEPTKALDHLAKAIYYDKQVKNLVLNNPELENLRNRKEFEKLL